MNDGLKESAAAPMGALAHDGKTTGPNLAALALGSVGVVYGDIGTSPLYAFREAAMAASDNHPVDRAVVLGVLSLILWALIVTITLKYVLILLRADNNGEGGTLSLTALASRALGRRTTFVFIVGVIGAAMFLGDSIITPAISVLSAVEGLAATSRHFEPLVGRVHQPPPVHQNFQGDGFVICSFCPRPFDFDPQAVPIPYNHANVMADEVIYYASSDFMSRRGIEFGSITLHPDGLPHGPHPGTVEKSLSSGSTDEYAVMMDTMRPLLVAKPALAVEDEGYQYSWLE